MAGKKLTVLIAATAILIVAAPAPAAEVTPEAYREQVEPICQANKAKEEILRNVRKEVREGQLKKAAAQIATAAKALKQAQKRLSQVPQPAEDSARLTKWLKGIAVEVELLEATGRKLTKNERNAATRMVIRLKSNAQKTNNLVLDYQFRYCRVDPSKFI